MSPYGAESRGWLSFGKTVPALKQECVAAGLVQSGAKFDLVLRIVQASKGTGAPKRAATEASVFRCRHTSEATSSSLLVI